MPCTTEQEALLACLARRSEKLARIYGGGLRVLYDDENPDRFSQAAHSMRELMDKSPILTGQEAIPQGDSMKLRIDPVKQAYLAVRAQGFNETSPLDAVEGPLRAVIGALDRFFEWMEENRPQTKRRTAQMLSNLSGPGQQLPVDISDNEVRQWMAADAYFKKVAHHGQDHVNENEFILHGTFVENVLLRRLQPPAVPDLDALDALIREGEHGH